ncbi:zinc-ribbon domain containing protein [uncultured Oscillibacter sp.]|uniref:zinc-ribbon domain containing protein n=1 Tax=uncultured Oscillibacter sp. TaxID=876091 RepID=UPI0028057C03|nr:zinc-ribbon domain containing protein [uncultured Oscillibacter sp.]
MFHTIQISQAAGAMKMEESQLWSLLGQCGIQPVEDSLTLEQVWQLAQALEDRKQESQRRSQEKLERLTEQYTLLIDTCSLLHPQFPLLIEHLEPLLRGKGKALIVPSGMVAELRNLLLKKPELAERIRALLPLMVQLRQQGLLRVFGGQNEDFGDQQMLTVVTRFMTAAPLLVITQDNDLSADLLRLNQLGSVRGQKVAVSRINRYGYLSRYLTPEQRGMSSSSVSGPGPFFPSAPLVEDREERLPACQFPQTGDLVRTNQGDIRLGPALAKGGEGTIYDLEDGTVAKIYREEKRTVLRRDKLALMTSQSVSIPGVCWPRELLWDGAGNFLGYRMERARGTELQKCAFTRQALERYFPEWKKLDMVHLAVTILEKISALHRCGVLLGDINPRNILVVSPEEVWLVDCDSYQVGGYPCPVGTVRFTAPEIQHCRFSGFLRTPGNEAFAVATLLFMLMLPGKSPYAQQGGEDLGEVIREMNFPYPCGENRSDHTPAGAWRFLWSHLPRYTKENFYGTFQRGGRYSTEQTRLTVEQWLTAFRYYGKLLEENKLQDPQSGELFPDRWKITDPDDLLVYQHAVCQECGKPFDITEGEHKFYRQHDLTLPRRCPSCRNLRKLERNGLSFSA